MNNDKFDFKDIFDTYLPKRESQYLYLDKTFYNKGIDYNKYIPIYYKVVNDIEIANIYTRKGWYIYCYLIANSINNTYAETTINIIAKDLKIKPYIVKDSLNLLEKKNKLKIQQDINQITNNDKIQIGLSYIYDYKNEGFVKIPIDYVKAIITSINDTQWGILTVLFVRYNYIYPTYTINDDTGEIIYNTQENCCAFPTQIHIAESIGVIDYQTIAKQLNILSENNEYNIIKIDKSTVKNKKQYYDKQTGEHRLASYNYIYHIPLFERIEYNYYYYYEYKDARREQKQYEYFFKELDSQGYKKISQSELNVNLTKIDYIKCCYKHIMEEYKKAIVCKDYEIYESVRKTKISK